MNSRLTPAPSLHVADVPPSVNRASTTVFIVDDDVAVTHAFCTLLTEVHLEPKPFQSAEAFLVAYDSSQAGCLILDVRLHGMSGLELQQHLVDRGIDIPTIIMTGYGDIAMVSRAMRLGAIDFLEKPIDPTALLMSVRLAIDLDTQRRHKAAIVKSATQRLETLSPREREVLELVVLGRPNKRIAAELGIALKTVEAHRTKVMKKLQANTVPSLVRLAVICELPCSRFRPQDNNSPAATSSAIHRRRQGDGLHVGTPRSLPVTAPAGPTTSPIREKQDLSVQRCASGPRRFEPFCTPERPQARLLTSGESPQ